jgi:hypothetical protein
MLDTKEVSMPTDLFEGEGIGALAVAAVLLLIAVVILVWLRGPGSRPHDPPIARDAVVGFAAALGFFAAGFVVRAIWGSGGFLVGCALVLVALGVAAVARRHARRT